MIPNLLPSFFKFNNESSIGKRHLLYLLVAVVFHCPLLQAEKKHRKELPIPKKEKDSPSLSAPVESGSIPAGRPKTEASHSPSSDKTKLKPAKHEVSKCNEKYPIETFMQIASASSPQSSSKGGVYFISDLREAPQVYTLENPKGWPEQLSFFPDGVRYFSVSPDGQKILMAADRGGDEQYDLYLFHTKTKTLTPLLVGRNKRIDSVGWGSNSNWFAFTSTERNQKDFDLYRYDLSLQKSTLLTTLEGQNVVTDISNDGNFIALQKYRSIVDADILLYNHKEKKILNLTEPYDSYASEGKFSSTGENIFFISDQEGGMPQVFQLSVNEPRTPRQISSGQWGVEALKMSREKDALVYLTNEEGYSRFHGFEIDKRGKRKNPLTLPDFANTVVGGFDFAPRYGKGGLFYTFSSSRQTSDVWLWKRGTNIRWTHSTLGQMNPNCFLAERLIRYPSFDKTEIPAFLYLPPGVSYENPTPSPFIVYVHGGPESQFRPGFTKTFQYFLQRGFGVLALNIRGSSGYGKDYTLMDNYKKRMDSIQDIVEGTKWLAKNQFGKSKMLSIYGGSYGGFAVLRTIQIEPTLFAAASASVGISNFVTFLKNTKAYRRELREVEYGPLSDEEFLKSISPIHYVKQIKTPLIIFHGANDPRVPVSETEQIVDELKKRDIPVDYQIFKDEGHGNKKLSNILIQARQMAYFFEKHAAEKD